MFRFANPEYLFFLLVIPVLVLLFIYAQIRRRQKIKEFGNPVLLAELMPNVSLLRPHFKFYIQLSAILLLIIVMAQPQFGTKEEKQEKNGIEVMVALDVSNSMLAQDISPSRLEKSKMVLSRLVDGMNNDKIGLVIFAGDAFIQLPITADYVSAKMFMSSISPKLIARQGTAIGSAIELCIKSFGEKKDLSRAIVVITDGENHEDDAVSAAKLAASNNIVVHVIGMGKLVGAPIPNDESAISFRKDKDGNVVVSKLNEEMAKNIAMAGNGVYVRADDKNTAYRVIAKELDNLAKSKLETKAFTDYNEQFQSFAILALIFLFFDSFILGRRNKRLSKMKIFDLKEKIIKIK